MKAFEISEFISDPLALQPIEIPTPGPSTTHYLVRIHACAVNFFDMLQIRGQYQEQRPFPWTAGTEFAGVIIATPTEKKNESASPADQTLFCVGDRVFGSCRGAYATHILAAGHNLIRIPQGWSFVSAAGLYVSLPTAYAALVTRGQMHAGEWVLVHAGAGAAGLSAIQIAKALGATVVATSGSGRKHEICRAYGADYVVDYRREDWPQEVLALCAQHRVGDGKAGVDVVFDPVGLIEQSLKCTAWNGRVVVVGFAGGQIEKVKMNRVLLKNVSLVGLHWGPYELNEPHTVSRVWDDLHRLIAGERIRGIVFSDREFRGLESIPRALKELESRATWGKVVVDLAQSGEAKPSHLSDKKTTGLDTEHIDHVLDAAATPHDMTNKSKNDAQLLVDTYTGAKDWSPSEEARIRHKIDRKLLTMLCCTYSLQYYDKAVLGQAAIFGLQDDLDLSIGNRYSMVASIFYLGFICGAYPASLLAQKYSIRWVAAGIVAVWGVCMTLTATVSSYRALYAQRFFLGMTEAGVSPIFMLLVGSWYTKSEQAYRMGIWYSCTGFISMFSPLINYGLGHITGGGLRPWQYMYLFAGGVTILWSVPLALYLPSDPVSAPGFGERERYIALARLRQNNAGVRDPVFRMAQAKEALMDVRFLLICAMAFCINITNGPVSSFAPIIIQSFGFSRFNSLLLGMPAGFWGGIVELLAPLAAYKISQCRTILIVLTQVGVVIACLLLLFLPWTSQVGLLIGVYLLSTFGGSYAVLMGLQLANTGGYTKRVVTSSGNFVGPMTFASSTRPRYRPGFIVTLVTAIIAAILSIVYRLVAQAENKRRDNDGFEESLEQAYDADLTDRTNREFRYVL
ncbi:hypothetical protein FE257_003739 [Aspergillus nanangensis]|uniref:Major facilitator superfamily (MFS) profile domain-containing protein n=1 Tax=Aspergillus nanangensis TaxID=2582783 RepID=A0AAD4CBD0_ASPNN|nr:hypothetical protein FE257_003739 [Aspergillus nanangensis]